MSARILDGKAVASTIHDELTARVASMKVTPGLAAILVGDNPASKVYVDIKRKTCEKVGIRSELHTLPEDTSEETLLALIDKLNKDTAVHAILVQLPIPKHISVEKVLSSIAVEKDVDGFHPINIGKLVAGNEDAVPCTPHGIIRLLDETGIELAGKHAVIVGRSTTVGKPVALMLLNRNATVTICHSKTVDLATHTKQADIVIAAVGRAGMITADMVTDGAIVIDVGINRVADKLVGDVDYDSVSQKASWITPVPGGVGPMTVAMLLWNTVERCQHG